MGGHCPRMPPVATGLSNTLGLPAVLDSIDASQWDVSSSIAGDFILLGLTSFSLLDVIFKVVGPENVTGSCGQQYETFSWLQCTVHDALFSGVRRKFSWGGFIQWHMVVICIWCALFVTSQFDVIVMFPNQRFGEVCWHNTHIRLHALPLIYVSLNWI